MLVLPLVSAGIIYGDLRGTSRVVFQAVRSPIRGPEIEERVHVDLVVVHADPATDYQISLGGGLIGETQARRKVILVGIKQGADTCSLNDQTPARDEDRKILAAVVRWTEVIPAEPQVQVEL